MMCMLSYNEIWDAIIDGSKLCFEGEIISAHDAFDPVHYPPRDLLRRLMLLLEKPRLLQYQIIVIFKPGTCRPVRAWFLEIVSVRTSVCVCSCVHPRAY